MCVATSSLEFTEEERRDSKYKNVVSDWNVSEVLPSLKARLLSLRGNKTWNT
jgi:hypothetical protein